MTILTGLTRKLVSQGLLNETKAISLQKQSQDENTSLVKHLISHKVISSEEIAEIASIDYGIPYLDLNEFDTDNLLKLNIKSESISKFEALPLFKRGNRIFIAISDPSNLQVLDDVKFQTGLHPEPIIVEDNKLTKLIQHALSNKAVQSLEDIEENDLDTLDIVTGEDSTLTEAATDEDDTPVIRFVNKMLLDAINENASDIHFEPYEKLYRVRFRRDGVLIEHSKPPTAIGVRLAARLKIMSRLDISERRLPQDGRFKMKLTKHRTIDFRVSTCPTIFGEKIVIRILDPFNSSISVDSLGFEDFQKKIFLENLEKPNGMILATGPTGSGKTITLYTALNILNLPTRNISTAEDPIEVYLQGVNQININPKIGLTFAKTLRSFLRQDPDILMVGEIRDLETAETAIQAAQTGHMVLSSLHTNSAASTLTRLMNMGVPAYNIASSISVIIAQRLARKLCNKCKTIIKIPESALLELGFKQEEIPSLKIYKAHHCSNCVEGFNGRVGIFEILPITKDIEQIIMSNGTVADINEQAKKNGVWSLRESGLNKIRQGLISIEELNRVILEK